VGRGFCRGTNRGGCLASSWPLFAQPIIPARAAGVAGVATQTVPTITGKEVGGVEAEAGKEIQSYNSKRPNERGDRWKGGSRNPAGRVDAVAGVNRPGKVHPR